MVMIILIAMSVMNGCISKTYVDGVAVEYPMAIVSDDSTVSCTLYDDATFEMTVDGRLKSGKWAYTTIIEERVGADHVLTTDEEASKEEAASKDERYGYFTSDGDYIPPTVKADKIFISVYKDRTALITYKDKEMQGTWR